jgi:hypothetical protein
VLLDCFPIGATQSAHAGFGRLTFTPAGYRRQPEWWRGENRLV